MRKWNRDNDEAKKKTRKKLRKIIISRLGSQEVTNSLNKGICLFQVRTMTALWEPNPLDLAWNFTEEGLHSDVLSFIVIAVD